jgi:hypothetical protein
MRTSAISERTRLRLPIFPEKKRGCAAARLRSEFRGFSGRGEIKRRHDAFVTVFGQKIETQTLDRNRVTRLGTTQYHLSVIELGEPVTQVAAGSSSFKIEWRENKVFIQPLEPGATTNLFIWTASGRLSYELVPAASVEQMHFAIDQDPTTVQAKRPEPVEHPPVVEQPKIPPAMLMESSPVKVVGSSRNHEKVEILLQDVYQKDGRVYLRYAMKALVSSFICRWDRAGASVLAILRMLPPALGPASRHPWTVRKQSAVSGIDPGATTAGSRSQCLSPHPPNCAVPPVV